MTFEPTRKQLAFVLPDSFRKAELIFQKQSGPGEQLRLTVKPDQKPRQVVSTQPLSRGLWSVILNWWDGKCHYWAEKEIRVD
ncbi:hypothetical protein GCM10027275_15080 [Rhabdobacter roseus]|uniref:Uncharacterized protein n=1 Tax=Rhabdobacter roseus TaxID=1655419 RepID=A0A840TTR2_9BACT|nr:hypothetical protein [Rhabdobacter roseus]MBB5283428.1 hypothetical protein [Rhabdobacter roseus]